VNIVDFISPLIPQISATKNPSNENPLSQYSPGFIFDLKQSLTLPQKVVMFATDKPMKFFAFTQPSGTPILLPSTPENQWTTMWGREPFATPELNLDKESEERLACFLKSISYKENYSSPPQLASVFTGVFAFLYFQGMQDMYKKFTSPPDFVVLHPATCAECGSVVEFAYQRWECMSCKKRVEV
jgi:hypothetical protein